MKVWTQDVGSDQERKARGLMNDKRQTMAIMWLSTPLYSTSRCMRRLYAKPPRQYDPAMLCCGTFPTWSASSSLAPIDAAAS